MMSKKLSAIALVGIVTVLATAAPGQADARHGGSAFAGRAAAHGRSSAVRPSVPRFQGHRGFDGRRFDGRFHNRAGIVAPFIAAPFVYPYAYPPAYVPPATYWYCPSYGAYYPQVETCPESWVPVTGYGASRTSADAQHRITAGAAAPRTGAARTRS